MNQQGRRIDIDSHRFQRTEEKYTKDRKQRSRNQRTVQYMDEMDMEMKG